MTQDSTNNKIYLADKGNTFIRLSDNYDMGDVIWLGNNDVIENYIEKEISVEEFVNSEL